MVVQHNLTAMNSNRMLGITTGTQAKSTEKLSSGYKINRAADDAAGLSISEKMRKQIRGLSQASLNAEDGISAVQTAEGALNEVQDMLQRMNELAVKAANGTMSENDRSYIQDEIKALETEIDRVAETTKFNETYLLKGDKDKQGAVDYQYTEKTAATLKIAGNTVALDATDAGVYGENGTEKLSAAEAIEKLENGEKLYSTAKVANPAKATVTTDFTLTPEAKAAVTAVATGTGSITYGVAFESLSDTVSADDQNALLDHLKTNGVKIAYTHDTATYTYDLNGLNGFTIDATGKVSKGGVDIAQITASGGSANQAEQAIKVTTGTAATERAISTSATQKLYDANGKELTNEEALAIYDQGGAGNGAANLYKESSVQTEATNVVYTPAETNALYDKDGNKISANGLQFYHEDGKYTGGLYSDKEATTAVTADTIDDFVDNTQTKTAALTLKLHVGADATDNNQISIDIEAMSAKGLGVNDLKVDGADDTNARDAIETIKAAIQQVSQQRSALGATQNRLEHTIANLDNVVENTTAAESQIRDTDMATEMVKYSNNNILAQAGQAMLAQANQSNQGVLSLLG